VPIFNIGALRFSSWAAPLSLWIGSGRLNRLEDKIRRLCAEVAAGKDNSALVPKLVELRQALHDHIERMRAKTMFYPIPFERRAVVEEPFLPENEEGQDETPKAS
jgi:hypothetical protein